MNGFDELKQSIVGVAHQMEGIHRRALLEYTSIVEAILRENQRDPRPIERTLDGLLDFCGSEAFVELFRRLCRHYWEIDPEATARYVQAYQEMWDSEAEGDDPKSGKNTLMS